jgi:mRNA-degrading endonuclease RelE of RelBE toxin-antitoxin system
MNYKLIPTKVFEKELKGLNKKYPSLKTDLKVVVEKIVANPRYGTPLGFDCFKIRLLIRSKGRGKSGGARLITCIKIKDQTVFLISI